MKLKIVEGDKYDVAIFYCPGCKEHHSPTIASRDGYTGPVWGFNHDLEHPTFTPSLLVDAMRPESRCHLFLTDGKIQFLSDCFHELAGQTVDLPDLSQGEIWNF